MPKTQQFASPSGALAMGANILLFAGSKVSGGTHQIQLLAAPLPPSVGGAPKFSVPTFQDQTGPSPVNGVITGDAMSSPPVPLSLDGHTAMVVYAAGGIGATRVQVQAFEWNGTGYTRTVGQGIVGIDAPMINQDGSTFGAATVPGEQFFVVAYWPDPGDQISQVVLKCYPTYDYTAYSNAETRYCDPPSTPAWGGDVSMTIVRNLVDGTTEEPYVILLAFPCDQTIYAGALRLGTAGTDGSSPAINVDGFQLQPLGIESDFSTEQSSLSMHRGPDGVAYMMFMDKQWRTLHWGAIEYQGAGKPLSYNGLAASAYYELDFVPPVVYSSGAFPDAGQSPDAVVPVYRTTIFAEEAFEITQIGSARRTVGPSTAPSEPPGMVVGFVDGGPPVPNENIQSLNPQINSVVATMTYGNETEQDTDTSFSLSVGLMVKMSEEGGLPWVGTVDVDTDFSAGYNGKWTQSTTQKLLQEFTQNTEIEVGSGGANQVAPDGTAYVYFAESYTPWSYDFLDANGNPNPMATSYIQLIPNEPSIRAYPYTIDTAGPNPIPGNLESYVMDGAELQRLESEAAIQCTIASGTGNFPETSWASSGGDLVEEVAVLTKSGVQNGFYADASEMVGGTVMGTKLQVGFQTKFDFDAGWGSSQTSQYKSEVKVTNPEAPYDRYTFKTLMLAPSAGNLAVLMQRLAYDDERGQNDDLKSAISTGSTPWYITYAIVDLNGEGGAP